MIWRLFALYNSFGYYRTKVRCKNFRPVFRTNTVSSSFHVVQRYACVSICLCCYVDAAASYRREKNFLLLSLSSSLSRTPIKNAREFSITVSNAFVTFDTSGNGGGFARTGSDFPLSALSRNARNTSGTVLLVIRLSNHAGTPSPGSLIKLYRTRIPSP